MATKTIDAGLPGVLYLKPSPGEPQFKNVGDSVSKGDTIALIEVMKSFIPVEATFSGTLVKFLADNEQAVDAGDPVCELDVAES